MVLEEDKKNLLSTVSDGIEQASGSENSGPTYLVVGVSLAILVASVLTFASIKSKQSKLDSLSMSIENEVTAPLVSLSEEQKQIETVKSQLDALTTALGSREQFGKLLSTLSSSLLKKSVLTSLVVQEENVTMAGSADSYSDVSKLVGAYRQMFSAQDVKLSSATLNEDSKKVDFSLSINIDRSKFQMNSAGSSADASGTPTDEVSS